jgi:glycosyltransferase involved in cell wall biosynthesis
MSMPATSTTVSVIMPVRDVVETVGSAVQSIRLQTFEDWELLVLDDGSTDGTLDLLSKFEDDRRIRMFADGRRLGLPRRLNQALTAARGRFVARMDGDDISYPERLECQLDFMQSHSEVDLVGTPMAIIGDDGQMIGQRVCPSTHERICARPRYGFPLFHPTFFGRTSWFLAYRYDPRAIRCEDQDLLLRSHLKSTFANLSETMYAYREGRIRLRKVLQGRWHYVRAVARNERMVNDAPALPRVFGTAAEHAGMAAVDTLAVTLHLERALLRRRARPAFSREQARWRVVRDLVDKQGPPI